MEQRTIQMIYFLLFNVVYLGFGITMIAYGAFSIQDMQRYGALTDNSFIAGAAIFIAVGLLKIVSSIVGVIATFVHKKPLIALYVVSVVLLMMLTFIAAIYAFQTRRPAYEIIGSRLATSYASDINSTDLQNVQSLLNCCGTNGVNDVPPGTCSSTRNIELVYGQGCQRQLGLLVTEQLYVVGAIGMGFAVFEGTAILVAMQHMQG